MVSPWAWLAFMLPALASSKTNPSPSPAPSGAGRSSPSVPQPPSQWRPTRYPSGSDEATALFLEAARLIGAPEWWASSHGLHSILRRESDGVVGRPNYTYGARAKTPEAWPAIHAELRAGRITAKSSATGLGQLLLRNVDRYYPAGRAGIGDPLQEAAGMLAYIRDRYGDPNNAWNLYGTKHEGY